MYSEDLVKNTAILHERVEDLTYTADEIANGSRGLLDEVATGKVTGEEEYWSRTDLWTSRPTSRVPWWPSRDSVRCSRRTILSSTARSLEFAAVQALLDAQREGDGFKTYDKLSQAEVKQLSDAVNAVGATVQAGRGGRLTQGSDDDNDSAPSRPAD